MMAILFSTVLPFLLLKISKFTQADVYVYSPGNKLVEDFDDQPANFGPPFPSNGLKGYVTLTQPRNACSRVSPPPRSPKPGYQWIALIPRTKSSEMCDFDLKVLNAQNANYSAVIIYNYEDLLVTMGPHGRDIQIPSTLITHSDGLSIINNYLYNTTLDNTTSQFYIRIDDEQFFKFGAYVIPLVVTIGISFLGLVGFMVIKCCLIRRRARRHRLPRSALKQLKTKKFVKGDRWEVCAICLDDYEDGAKLRILPCDHAYHMKCIDPWLLNNRRQCPVCKRYVFPNNDNSDEEEANPQAPTERTPLIQSTDDHTTATPPRNRPYDRRIFQSSTPGASNITSTSHESSDTDDELISSGSTRHNHVTTDSLIFTNSTLIAQDDSRTELLPNVIVRQLDSREESTNDTTLFESVRDSISSSFTTPRAANFFVGSLGGTTDNTNISAHSVVEDTSSSSTNTTNDERMQSVLTDVEINHGYVSDHETTDLDRTNL